ncbi:MAG: hypothetical protein ABI601_02100 [bacterium]
MPDDEGMTSAAAGRDGLVTQLRALEAFVERSDAEGDALPPEATEMIARLREIVQALDGLTASISADQAPPADPAPSSPES